MCIRDSIIIMLSGQRLQIPIVSSAYIQFQNFVQDDVYGRSCLYSNWKFLLIVKWSRYGKGILSQRWWSDCKDEKTLRFWRFQFNFFSWEGFPEKTLRFWRFQFQFFPEKAFLGPRRGLEISIWFFFWEGFPGPKAGCEWNAGVLRDASRSGKMYTM